MLSQDLLQASLEIPFSVPPYMSLLARAVATLEGIALTGDPDYQMVTQVIMECVASPADCNDGGTAGHAHASSSSCNGVGPAQSSLLYCPKGHLKMGASGSTDVL